MIATVYKRLIQIGKISGAITFLFAAPYALNQYIETRNASRVEQTLKLFNQYNSSPFTTYREKITKALVRNKTKILTAAKDQNDLVIAQLQIIKDEDIETELLFIFDFFDAVTVCVVGKICDNDTAVKLFRPRALDIYLNFYQYMMLQRATVATKDFGIGVEAVAKSRT